MGTGIQNRNWIELQLHQQACISIPGKLDQVLSLPCFGVPTLTPKLLSGALQLQTPALLLTPYHSAPLFTWYHLHRFSINFDVTSALSPEVREDLLINPSIILNLLMNTSPFFSWASVFHLWNGKMGERCLDQILTVWRLSGMKEVWQGN